MTKRRIGILGGTFDPVHRGHLLLAEAALLSEKLDGVMFLPSGQPYQKMQENVSSFKDRLCMVRLAVEAHPGFFVSDMEIRRQGDTYTCDTLKELEEADPEAEYYFLLGADCLFSIEEWKDPGEIFKRCTLLVAARGGCGNALFSQCGALKKKYGAKVKLLPFEEIPISSSVIRRRIKDGEDIRDMVPGSVVSYIEEHALYR